MSGRFPPRLVAACLALLLLSPLHPQSRSGAGSSAELPVKERLSYGVEWRLIYAGSAQITHEEKRVDDKPPGTIIKLHLESGGLVSKLYKLDDNYETHLEDQFCSTYTHLDAMEGKRHRDVQVSYDYSHGKAMYVERDVLKGSIIRTAEAEIPSCVSDIIGGLYRLRSLKLEPGGNIQIPLSDGRKTVSARIEAQEREQIKTKAGNFNAIRYEAFVFNGALYARKGQLHVWITDDSRRLPIQFRVRAGFPIGSITLQLEKDEHS